MQLGIKAGIAGGLFYFALVFFGGLAFGALSTVYLVPQVGSSFAAGVELPIILLLAWHGCHWFMVKCSVETWQDRLAMAVVAFGLLLFANWVARFVFNQFVLGEASLPPVIVTARFADGLRLSGQIIFGLLPLVMRTDIPSEMWPRPPSR